MVCYFSKECVRKMYDRLRLLEFHAFCQDKGEDRCALELSQKEYLWQ